MMDLYAEAMQRFDELFEEGKHVGLAEPTAMTLATADPDGRPSSRTVLLKGRDPRGFVFYTNQHSRKGQQLDANAQAAICFYWPPLARQVAIEGTVETVSDQEADEYWATRPRESQLGGWASLQSQPLPSRQELEARFAAYSAQYAGQPVPRPAHWSGYRLIPQRIEIWESRPHRLHHRVCYVLGEAGWSKTLLYP